MIEHTMSIMYHFVSMRDYRDVLKQIGLNLRAERVRKGYSQEKFAEITGVSTNYIGKVERGEQNLTIKKLVEISNALGVGFERIFLDK